MLKQNFRISKFQIEKLFIFKVSKISNLYLSDQSKNINRQARDNFKISKLSQDCVMNCLSKRKYTDGFKFQAILII